MEQPRTKSETGEGQVDIPLNFNFEVVDVRDKLGELAYNSTLGWFRAAHESSDSILEDHRDVFPIAFEIVRLLYDQGQYGELRKTIEAMIDRRPSLPSGVTTTLKPWTEQELGIFILMDTLSVALIYCNDRYEVHKSRLQTSVTLRLERLSPEKLDDEHVILAVLLLRLRYLEHEVGAKLPAEHFRILLGDSPPALVSRLLQDEYFWGAENVLEVCFRREGFNHHTIDLQVIWQAIERFLNDKGDERQMWAQIGILQTFCEGCLRRNFADVELRPPGLNVWSWTRGMKMLADRISDIDVDTWIKTRPFIRQELLMLDHRIWQQVKQSNPTLEKETVAKLIDLLTLARKNDDNRSQAGVQWRIEVLINCKDPKNISAPHDFTAVPSRIYIARHDLINHLAPGKLQSFISWARRFGQTMLEEAGPDQAMANLAGERFAAEPGKKSSQGHRRVVLLGHTGTGKSTLFRTITGKYAATSRSDSTTLGIQRESTLRNDGSVLHVIDTPGLGDPEVSDYMNFHRICQYLEKEFKSARLLHGVFYLINVQTARIDGQASKQAEVFKSLVGDHVWPNVTIIFTHVMGKHQTDPSNKDIRDQQVTMIKKWRDGIFEDAKAKGAKFVELGLDFKYSKGESAMLDQGGPPENDFEDNLSDDGTSNVKDHVEEVDHDTPGHVHRPADHTQVERIVSALMQRQGPITLECQYEMCTQGKPFNETQVALNFENRVRQGLDERREEIARCELERRNALQESAALQRSLEELLQTMAEKEQKILDAERANIEAIRRAEQIRTETVKQARAEAEEQQRLIQQELERVKEKERMAALQEIEGQKRKIKDAEQRLRVLRSQQDTKRKEEEAAKQASKKLQMDIDAIEALAGWSPRFIIHNKSKVTLHLRLLNAALLNLVVGYENHVEADKLRAIRAAPGPYLLETFLSFPGNDLTKKSVAYINMGSLGYLAAAFVTGPLMPSVLAALGAGAGLGFLWACFNSGSNYKQSTERNMHEKFSSGVDTPVKISSSVPVKRLDPRADAQMLIMALTGKGERICLFQSDYFSLFRCTRLEIHGGPRCIHEDTRVVYEFDRDTKPMTAQRVDKFVVDN